MLSGTAFAFLCYFVLSLITSAVAYNMSDPLGYIGILGLVALLMSGAVSGYAVSRVRGEGGFLAAILSSLFFTLIQILIGLIVAKGDLTLGVFFNYLCYIAISAFCAFLGGRRKRRRY